MLLTATRNRQREYQSGDMWWIALASMMLKRMRRPKVTTRPIRYQVSRLNRLLPHLGVPV
jgi:hypothetical protein